MRLIDADKLKEELDCWARVVKKPNLYSRDDAIYIIESQPTVNQWIPVSERLPECEEEVWIQTEKGTVTTAMYEDGTMEEDDSVWNWNDIDYNYDDENDIRYIPEGWWEYKHFAPDDVYNYAVDEKVVAWMSKPEPYKEEE
jgi:hypothetical protein